MKPRLLPASRLSFPLATALAALLASSIQGQTVRSWNGATGSAWLTTGSWTPSGTFAGNAPNAVVTGEGAATDIMTVAAANSATNVGINMSTLSGLLSLGGIDFNKTNTSTLQIGNSSTTVNGILQLNGATINSVPKTLIRVAGSANLTIANVNTGTGSQTMGLRLGITDGIFDVASGRTLTISSIISEVNANSGFTKSGAGALTLSGANTYTGTTAISGGVLALGAANALGTTSALSMSAGTTLRANVGVSVTAPITLSGTGNITIAAGTNTALTAAYNGAISGSTSNLVFSSAATNNAAHVITLGAAGTYTGDTIITGSDNESVLTLRSGVANALPSGTVLKFDTRAGSGSGRLFQFDLNGNNQTLAGLDNGGAVPTARNHRVTNTSPTLATLTINGSTNTQFGGGFAGTFSGNPYTVRGQIQGNLALVKNGSGTFTLGGTLNGGATLDGNSFTGDTTVLGGILVLGETLSIKNSAFDTGASIAGDATNGLRAGIGGTGVTTLTLGGLKGGNSFSSRFTTTTGGYANLTGLTLNPGTDSTPSYSGDVGDGAGAMNLTKTGAGTQILTGSNTHTGATLVSTGTLALSGAGDINSSSGITINGSGAKLLHTGGTAISPVVTLTQGTLTGSSTVNTVNVGAGTGGIISNNDGVAGASLTIGTLTFNGVGTVNTFHNGISAPIITTNGGNSLVTSGGIVTINPTAASWTAGTYDLISYTGTYAGGGVGDFQLGTVVNAGARQTKALGNSGTAITLTLGVDDKVVWSGANGGNWITDITSSPTSGTPNWALKAGLSATDFWAADQVEFNDTYDVGGGPLAPVTTLVNISAADVSPASVLFNHTAVNYTLSGGFAITGATGLTKNGSGSLTVTNTNTYTGATAISGGILQLGDGGTGGALSASSAITVGSGATFSVNQSDTVTQGTDFSSADITGAGGFTQAGSGTTVLNVANTYTGTTAINGGTLQLGSGGTTGALTGTTGISSSGTATLAINRSNAFTQATDLNGQAITGTNLALTQAGTGTTTLSLANSYGGLTTINSGVLRITDAGALGGTSSGVVVNGNNTGAATNARLELSGGITVTGESATIKGNGNFLGALQSFSGSNEWAGNITIDADGTRIGAASGASLLVSGVIDDGINDYRLMYRVGDAAASVTLTGANTYTGPTSIVGTGPVIVGSLNSVVGGSASSHLGAPVTAENGRIIIGTTTVNGVLRYTGNGETTDRTIQIGENAPAPVAGDTGSATIESSGTTGALVFSAPNFNTPTNALTGTTPARTLTLGGSNTNANTISGVIQNNQIAGSPTAAVNVTKTGAGSWALAGANTYTGTTTIDNGTLVFSTVNQSLTGGLTFGASAGSTNTGNLDLSAASATFSGAFVARTENSTAPAGAITIGSGQALTLGAGMTVGFDSASNTVTKLNVTGAGALNITGGNFQLGGNTTTTVANAATLDMSGLSTFTYNVSGGTFRVGDATNSGGGGTGGSTLILADTSTITAAFLTTNNPGNQTQTIKLGSVANTINASSISIGAVTNRASGVMEFNESTGNLTIRDTAGTGRANLAVVYGNSNTGVNPTGIVDLTGAGHSADLLLGNLQIAGRTAASGGGATGTFSFQNGTLDATGITIAVRGARTTAGAATTGTLNLGGGTVTIGSGGINVANNSSAAAGDALVTGTVNISGGTVSIGATGGTSITLGSNSNAVNGGTVANLNLTGGTTTLAGDIVRGTATGTVTSSLTLNGASATLDMGGNDITNLTSITYTDGTLKNLGIVNTGMTLAGTGSRVIDQGIGVNGTIQGDITGTGVGLTVKGDGELTLSGVSSTYDGATTIDGGHLNANNITAAATSSIGSSSNAASNLVLKNGATLHYTGTATPAATDRLFTLGAGDNEIRSSGTGGITFSNTGNIDFADSGARILSLRAVTASATNTLASVIGDGAGGATQLHKHGDGTWVLTGNNTFTGRTLINAGTLSISAKENLGDTGTGKHVDFNGGTLQTTATMTFNTRIFDLGTNGGTFEVAAGTTLTTGFSTGKIQGSGNLAKTGAGTLEILGTNAYTGATAVTAGTLVVNGNISTSNVTVSGTGSTLKGNGSIGGTVTISSGSIMATGNSIESLATGALTLDGGSTFAYELDNDAAAGVAGDLTAVTGTLDISSGAILTLTELGSGSWTMGEKLTLISYSGAWNSGLFTYLGSPLNDDSSFTFSGVDWLFDYNDTSAGNNYTGDLTTPNFVTMTVIPEPRAALLGALGALMLLRRRR